MFLPDRYVRGTCPKCGTLDQYGDSCESCGATYTPGRPQGRNLGRERHGARAARFGAPVLPARRLRADAAGMDRLGPPAAGRDGKTRRVVLRRASRLGHLARRAVLRLRDPGRDRQVFLRLARCAHRLPRQPAQHCRRTGADFDRYWKPDSDAEVYHFIGKDIVYFHTLFWPAVLHGAGYRPPTAVYAHGFLTVNGQKMSKSRGTFITARAWLDHLPAEYLRYYFAARLGPGVDDLDLNLDDFVAKVNSDLVGKLVNIASRCAGFIARGSAGRLADRLPEPALYEEFAEARRADRSRLRGARLRGGRARSDAAHRPRQPLHRSAQAVADGQGSGAGRRRAGRLHPGH